MNLIDIKTAIVEKIKSIGGIVTASEVKEGFSKPTYFVDIFPIETEAQNAYYELVTLSVEIRYAPLLETVEECIKETEKLKALFSEPINVGDRYLNAENPVFEMDASFLLCTLNISYMQNTATTLPDYDKMENLNTKEVVNSGTTTNSN